MKETPSSGFLLCAIEDGSIDNFFMGLQQNSLKKEKVSGSFCYSPLLKLKFALRLSSSVSFNKLIPFTINKTHQSIICERISSNFFARQTSD